MGETDLLQPGEAQAVIDECIDRFGPGALPVVEVSSTAEGGWRVVVVEDLIPEMSQGKHSNIGTVFFAVGFSVMMTLDVALG